ncbi:MAG TPA: toll/interleukin-1 receptor domain-containing protein [Hyphomonadaceae bacterium]|nr:toll/interleukin-1 receptor domain-containing protein [Hyphomonadaceae bacterium]
MADIFISYRREDRRHAEQLANAFIDDGLEVWWDGSLEAGETYDEKIQTLLQSAKAVVILWSPAAVESDWVRSEGSVGRERGVLVPVMIKKVEIPVPFNLIHTANLTKWDGDRTDPDYVGVLKRVKELSSKQNVKPLKPATPRAMRRMWTAIAAAVVIAIGGASLWFFKPWEAVIAANDPVVKAKAKRDAALKELAATGLLPTDLDLYDWRQIARERFNPANYDTLRKQADAGNAPAQAVLCAVSYWGVRGHEPDDDLAWKMCRASAEANEPAGQVYYSVLLTDRATAAPDEDHKRVDLAAAAAEVKKASDQGFPRGILDYGYRLETGEGGVVVDLQKALDHYNLAKAKGLAIADLAIGELYLRQTIENSTDQDAFAHIKAAADKGEPNAVYRLAQLYHDGRGTKKDLKASLALYQQAEKYDNADMAMRAHNMVTAVQQEIDQAAQEPPPN